MLGCRVEGGGRAGRRRSGPAGCGVTVPRAPRVSRVGFPETRGSGNPREQVPLLPHKLGAVGGGSEPGDRAEGKASHVPVTPCPFPGLQLLDVLTRLR